MVIFVVVFHVEITLLIALVIAGITVMILSTVATVEELRLEDHLYFGFFGRASQHKTGLVNHRP